MLFRQVERYPEAQHRPGGFRHKGRNGDTVEALVFRYGFQRGKEGQLNRRRFIVLLDKRQLGFAEVRVFFRVMIERPPQYDPYERQRAGEHKCALPAERGVREVDNRRRQHGADGETNPGPACGDRALGFRKPLAERFGVGWRRRRLSAAHEKAQNRQVQPAPRAGMGDAGDGPQRGADHKAELEANDVDKPAAERLKNGIRQLKSADDPRVLFSGNTERGF